MNKIYFSPGTNILYNRRIYKIIQRLDYYGEPTNACNGIICKDVNSGTSILINLDINDIVILHNNKMLKIAEGIFEKEKNIENHIKILKEMQN